MQAFYINFTILQSHYSQTGVIRYSLVLVRVGSFRSVFPVLRVAIHQTESTFKVGKSLHNKCGFALGKFMHITVALLAVHGIGVGGCQVLVSETSEVYRYRRKLTLGPFDQVSIWMRAEF